MALGDDKSSILALLHSLSERLRRVLVGDARKYAAAAQSAITIDVYLAALYRAYPEEVASFFSKRGPLDKIADMYSSIDIAVKEIAPLEIQEQPPAILLLRIEDQLLHLFSTAVKLSSDSGRGPADLADFLGALRLNTDAVTRLAKERSLDLKELP